MGLGVEGQKLSGSEDVSQFSGMRWESLGFRVEGCFYVAPCLTMCFNGVTVRNWTGTGHQKILTLRQFFDKSV